MDNYDENSSSLGNEEIPVKPVDTAQQNPYEPPIQNNYSVDPTSKKAMTNKSALSGFILSIVSLFIFGVPLGIAALIVSIVGMSKAEVAGGKGFAIAGIAISVIGIILAILGAAFLSAYY